MPGGKANIKPADNTNGFQKNPQNINRNGRPRKIYTIVKEMGFAPEDTIDAFKELVYYNLKDLDKIEKDESKPAIIRIIAAQLNEAYKRKDFSRAKEILEYVIGKPNQPVQISGGIGDSKHIIEFRDFEEK